MAYLNFALEITQQSDGKMCITVLSSPVGEASAVVENPFSPAEIDAALALFGGRSADLSRFQATRAARQFGQRLFNFLIRHNDDINAAYFASLDRSGTNGLRIRLSTEKAGVLAGLPWELLADPTRDFLALSRLTPIVRYTQQLTIRPPVPVALPLRVLVMIAAPADHPTLDVEGEWQRLQTATADLQRRGMIHLERLESATLIALQRKLRAEDYHVFHFIGHSAYDEVSQQGVLVLEHEQQDQHSQVITGAALARELGEESTVRLVVLNSCQSARHNLRDPFSGIASSVVVRGIPAVVAMQFPISDQAAQVFAEEFYRAISESLPIDSAVSEARRAIANRLQTVEWATPVLFLRSEDGVLFRPQAQSGSERVGPLGLPVAGLVAAILFVALVGIGALVAALGRPAEPAILPDLEVASIRSAPLRPAPGAAFRLLIGIRNAGEDDSGPFNWTWDASPTRLNALEGHVENIAPGATQYISFPYNYGWWGVYSSQIVVDVDGNVRESDERDNRRSASITLDPDSPFTIDFSLLPSNEIITVPRALAPGEFAPWNLAFSLAANQEITCATSFRIVDLPSAAGPSVRVLTPGEDVSPACAESPLVVNLALPVGSAAVHVLPAETGTLRMRAYGGSLGRQLVAESETEARTGQLASLAVAPIDGLGIRRVEIEVSGPVHLSELTLFPLPG